LLTYEAYSKLISTVMGFISISCHTHMQTSKRKLLFLSKYLHKWNSANFFGFYRGGRWVCICRGCHSCFLITMPWGYIGNWRS